MNPTPDALDAHLREAARLAHHIHHATEARTMTNLNHHKPGRLTRPVVAPLWTLALAPAIALVALIVAIVS